MMNSTVDTVLRCALIKAHDLGASSEGQELAESAVLALHALLGIDWHPDWDEIMSMGGQRAIRERADEIVAEVHARRGMDIGHALGRRVPTIRKISKETSDERA